jgi:hypothetical protein
LGRALDEQVNRLPAKYREVFVLCDLGRKSLAEAACELGCPVGTVASRLVRARARLRAALTRRGWAVSAGLLSAGLNGAAPATGAVTPVVKAAALVSAGRRVSAGVVPARVAALTEGVLKAMQIARWKNVLTACTAAVALVLAAGWAAQQLPAASDPASKTKKGNPNQAKEPTLPAGPMPFHALAVLDKKGRVAVTIRFPDMAPGAMEGGVGPGGGGGPLPPKAADTEPVTRSFRLKKVQAFETSGKKVEAKELARRLRRKVALLVSADGKAVDPLHLRLFKEGLLVLVVAPERKAAQVIAPPAQGPGPGGGGGGAPPGGQGPGDGAAGPATGGAPGRRP